jgi:hypothetical protein
MTSDCMSRPTRLRNLLLPWCCWSRAGRHRNRMPTHGVPPEFDVLKTADGAEGLARARRAPTTLLQTSGYEGPIRARRVSPF